ncbi:hypothetical protein H0I23_16330 [Cellulophaga sp. HaHaR_3_176]|uniref:hypothetical protein n=1 Tax=Cellulophaga sp. HaHaR_3_176 TaxID=1942464 RepID=UPI001C1F4CD6|nr:hypothetical protein [Cellulophaga sp. HaHaR_3_176]QWX83994.1 hypothetical protein H0I23_16330 [Cellulophaga sp. HaHaR_3_176]
MRIVIVFLSFFLLISCDLFTSKEEKTQRLIESEIQSIDFNDLDQFPLFENCSEANSKENNKACFQETLLNHFSASLEGFEFILKKEILDTLYVDFLMDKKGEISVLDIENNAIVSEQIPEFDAIITNCLLTLPQASPALKRGIPVKAKFRVPIVLNTK